MWGTPEGEMLSVGCDFSGGCREPTVHHDREAGF